MKDACYIKLHGISFFMKEKGFYTVCQQRGKGLNNRRKLGICVCKPTRVWEFVSFVYPYKSAVGGTRVEALRASMDEYIVTYKSSAPADDDKKSQ